MIGDMMKRYAPGTWHSIGANRDAAYVARVTRGGQVDFFVKSSQSQHHYVVKSTLSQLREFASGEPHYSTWDPRPEGQPEGWMVQDEVAPPETPDELPDFKVGQFWKLAPEDETSIMQVVSVDPEGYKADCLYIEEDVEGAQISSDGLIELYVQENIVEVERPEHWPL